MVKKIKKPSEASLLKLLDIQWQDHFQTRNQTWKALEIAALLAVALVGADWKINNQQVTMVVAFLLATVALFGMQITLRHRNRVEVMKFNIIKSVGEDLGLVDSKLELPKSIHWWDVFLFWKSNTSLFILRMQFVILIFSIGYLVLRLLGIKN
jgi:hypothetical protein